MYSPFPKIDFKNRKFERAEMKHRHTCSFAVKTIIVASLPSGHLIWVNAKICGRGTRPGFVCRCWLIALDYQVLVVVPPRTYGLDPHKESEGSYMECPVVIKEIRKKKRPS